MAEWGSEARQEAIRCLSSYWKLVAVTTGGLGLYLPGSSSGNRPHLPSPPTAQLLFCIAFDFRACNSILLLPIHISDPRVIVASHPSTYANLGPPFTLCYEGATINPLRLTPHTHIPRPLGGLVCARVHLALLGGTRASLCSLPELASLHRAPRLERVCGLGSGVSS